MIHVVLDVDNGKVMEMSSEPIQWKMDQNLEHAQAVDLNGRLFSPLLDLW